jgi:predicted NBD/HSP70 family sugar kinase
MRAIEARAAALTGATQDVPAIRAAADRGETWATEIVDGAGRALGRAIAALIGALDIERIVLLGPATELGGRWLAAVRGEATIRALALLADDVEISVARPTTNVVIRGASALLVARELGLSLVR